MAALDLAPFKGRPVDEPLLEDTDASCVFLYVNLRNLAVSSNVIESDSQNRNIIHQNHVEGHDPYHQAFFRGR